MHRHRRNRFPRPLPPSRPPDLEIKEVRLLGQILAVLIQIRDNTRPVLSSALNMVVHFKDGTTKVGNKMAIVFNDAESVTLSLQEMKPDPAASGKTSEVPVVGPVVWSTSDAKVVSITPSSDTFSAVAAAVGPNGIATVTAVADSLTATLDITVVDSEVASLTIVPGTPFPTVPGSPGPGGTPNAALAAASAAADAALVQSKAAAAAFAVTDTSAAAVQARASQVVAQAASDDGKAAVLAAVVPGATKASYASVISATQAQNAKASSDAAAYVPTDSSAAALASRAVLAASNAVMAAEQAFSAALPV